MYGEPEIGSLDSTLGSSPPCRPVLAEGSDLFKSVMDDFLRKDSKLTRAVVDSVIQKDRSDGVPRSGRGMYRNTCRRCFSPETRCVCYTSSKHDIHRVQWIDEIYDKPLAIEKNVSDITLTSGSHSALCDINRDLIKPILKHKANCIIVISE